MLWVSPLELFALYEVGTVIKSDRPQATDDSMFDVSQTIREPDVQPSRRHSLTWPHTRPRETITRPAEPLRER